MCDKSFLSFFYILPYGAFVPGLSSLPFFISYHSSLHVPFPYLPHFFTLYLHYLSCFIWFISSNRTCSLYHIYLLFIVSIWYISNLSPLTSLINRLSSLLNESSHIFLLMTQTHPSLHIFPLYLTSLSVPGLPHITNTLNIRSSVPICLFFRFGVECLHRVHTSHMSTHTLDPQRTVRGCWVLTSRFLAT